MEIGSEWERERGAGSGKVFKPGFELGMPIAQRLESVQNNSIIDHISRKIIITM